MSDKPTVALVADSIHDFGGMERAYAELIRRGQDRFRFVVVSRVLAPELRPLVEWRRVRVPGKPAPLRFTLFSIVAGAKLARVKSDLVHTLGAIVPNRADVATVQFCHAGFRATTGALAPENAPLLRRLNTTIARFLALRQERRCYDSGRIRILAAVSRGVARELEQHYPGVPVALTPNGVDLSRFRPDSDGRARLREAEGAGDDLIALFVGGDWDRKGLEIAIDGVARAARTSGLRHKLWVVGRGDEARFASHGRRAGLNGDLRFFGSRPDVERFLEAADLLVLPTLYETFSLVAYEAAASALPVIATKVSGIEDLLEGDDAGILVERTAESVAHAITLVSGDDAFRRRLGDEGRRRASTYDWSFSVAAVLDVYDRLLT